MVSALADVLEGLPVVVTTKLLSFMEAVEPRSDLKKRDADVAGARGSLNVAGGRIEPLDRFEKAADHPVERHCHGDLWPADAGGSRRRFRCDRHILALAQASMMTFGPRSGHKTARNGYADERT
jgi:hypothetical protein